MTHRPDSPADARHNERGAALITALLVSLLMLTAGGALIMSTSMSAANTMDATAEAQAFYAAEAGIQGAINALRGNTVPSTALTGGATMNFRAALTPSDSNAPGDPSTAARLSRWLPYSSRTTAGTRVSLNSSAPTSCDPGCYSITIAEPDGVTTAAGTEPPLLVITSTGYGPKGAQKRLQALVSNYRVNIDPPATIVAAGGNSVNFSLGSSNSVILSGENNSRPAIAVSAGNVSTAQNEVDSVNAQGSGTQVSPANVGSLGTTVPQPSWLQTPDAARAFLKELYDLASADGRLFSSKPASMGTLTEPKLTFIDNYNGSTVTLGTGFQGSGLLVITGELDTDGGTSFDGIILVMGRGVLTRSGGGSGVMSGSLIIASFDPTNPNADTFNSPTFTISGGGNATMRFDPVSIGRALRSTGRGVLGVVEN